MDMIKYELQYYDNLMNSKHQLNSELKDVQKLLNKVTSSIEQLQNSNLTEEEAVQLAHFESKKIELLTRLNEIAQNFNSVNQELDSYNVEKTEDARQLISVTVEFSKVSEDIKAAEKLSKKSNGPKFILENAEGRKKEIDQQLAKDYKELVDKKKELMIKQKEAYKKLNNIPSLKEQKEVLQQIEQVEPVLVNNNEVVEINPFDNLSLDEKISETKKRIDRIIKTSELPNQGKKRLITYNNQKYDIPKIYYGRFSETMSLLNKLEQEKNKTQASETQANEKEVLNETKEEQNIQPVEAIVVKKRKVIDIKNKLKKHWKSIAAAALAITISASALAANLTRKIDNELNYTTVQTMVADDLLQEKTTKDMDSLVQEAVQHVIANDANFIENNQNITLDSLNNVEQNQDLSLDSVSNINIGTMVSVTENAPIYSNINDATNQTNKLVQTYPNSNLSVAGVVYKVNGNLVFVTDANQINEFNKMGCEITALGLSLDGQNITGFYNIDNVNVNTIEGTKTL